MEAHLAWHSSLFICTCTPVYHFAKINSRFFYPIVIPHSWKFQRNVVMIYMRRKVTTVWLCVWYVMYGMNIAGSLSIFVWVWMKNVCVEIQSILLTVSNWLHKNNIQTHSQHIQRYRQKVKSQRNINYAQDKSHIHWSSVRIFNVKNYSNEYLFIVYLFNICLSNENYQ